MGYFLQNNRRYYRDPFTNRLCRDDHEWVPRRKQNNNNGNGDDNPFQRDPNPDTYTTNPDCDIFNVPLHIEITETHFVSEVIETGVQTRAGTKPGQNYDILKDPNIGLYLQDFGVTIDGSIIKLNGVDITFDDLLVAADISATPGRNLGGTVSPRIDPPLSLPDVIVYDDIEKTTDPTRNGPVYKSKNLDLKSWNIYQIPKVQNAYTITYVTARVEWSGLDANAPPLPGIKVEQDNFKYYIITPPWPTLISSMFVTITVDYVETIHPECKRTNDFLHWVDYDATKPVLRLGIIPDSLSNPVGDVNWGNSYQTDIIPSPTAPDIPDRLSPAALQNNPTSSIVESIAPSHWYNPSTRKRQLVTHIDIYVGQKLDALPPNITDWTFLAAPSRTAYKTDFNQSTPIEDQIGKGIWCPELAWYKAAVLAPVVTALDDIYTFDPFLAHVCENFNQTNPPGSFPTPPQYNGIAKNLSDDYGFESVNNLSKYYSDKNKYFPTSYLHPWTPKGDPTRPNAFSLIVGKSRSFRNIIPISSSSTGRNVYNWYRCVIPQQQWGNWWFQLESKLLSTRVTLQTKITKEIVTTTRNGNKIADSAADGTSYHTGIVGSPLTLGFTWSPSSTLDKQVSIPFGIDPGPSIPFTYTVTAPDDGRYNINIPGFTQAGIARGVVLVQHFNQKAGYLHFFEIDVQTSLPRISVPRVFALPVNNQNTITDPPAVPGDQRDGTMHYWLERTGEELRFQKGARTEPNPIIAIPWYNSPNVTALPALILNLSNTQNGLTATCTFKGGHTQNVTQTLVGTQQRIPVGTGVTTAKNNSPQGFQMVTVEFTNILRVPETVNQNILPNNLGCIAVNTNMPPGFDIATWRPVDVHHEFIPANPSTYTGLFPPKSAYDWTGKDLTSPAVVDGMCRMNFDRGVYVWRLPKIQDARIESLCVWYQGGLFLGATGNGTGTQHMSGCDVNQEPISGIIVAPSCITDTGTHWEIRGTARIGGFGYIIKFTCYVCPDL